MLDQVDQVVEILLAEKIPQLLLYEYSTKNYATPRYMRHLEAATRKVIPFVNKSAITAKMSLPKKMILKGYNLLFKRNIVAFETREEALRYLSDDTTSNYDLPEVYRR